MRVIRVSTAESVMRRRLTSRASVVWRSLATRARPWPNIALKMSSFVTPDVKAAITRAARCFATLLQRRTRPIFGVCLVKMGGTNQHRADNGSAGHGSDGSTNVNG